MTGDWVVDLVLWLAVRAVRVAWWLWWTPTRRCVGVSPALPLIYWGAVLLLLGVGARGWALGGRVFSGGEDVRAFDPADDRASWLGRWPVAVLRSQVRIKALHAASRVAVGFPGAALVYMLGLLGWWALPVALWWPASWARRARRRAWWEA